MRESPLSGKPPGYADKAPADWITITAAIDLSPLLFFLRLVRTASFIVN